MAETSFFIKYDQKYNHFLKFSNGRRPTNKNYLFSIISLNKLNHLYSIGEFDGATLHQMKAPRCGQPDFQPETLLFSLPQKYYWHKWDLTYRVEKYTSDLSKQEIDQIFGDAFQQWSKASGLTFNKTSNSMADILMK